MIAANKNIATNSKGTANNNLNKRKVFKSVIT